VPDRRENLARPLGEVSVENVVFNKTGHLAIGLPCPFMADSVEKVFLTDERIFLGPPVRCSCGDVRDHIVSHRNDHRPPYRSYDDAFARRSSLIRRA
jgi:hypothetical protein